MSVAQALAVAVVICAGYFYEVQVMPYTLAGITSGHAAQSGHSARVLYVLECEGSAEWQPVPAEKPVVSWVQHMKDRLTMHSGNPEGEDLTVRTVPSHWCCSRYCLFLRSLLGLVDQYGGRASILCPQGLCPLSLAKPTQSSSHAFGFTFAS